MSVKRYDKIEAIDFNSLYNRLAQLQRTHQSFAKQTNAANFNTPFVENPISTDNKVTVDSIESLNDELTLLKNSTWESDVSYDILHTAPSGYTISVAEQVPESIPHIDDNPVDDNSITVGNLIKAAQFNDINNTIDEVENVKLSYSTQYKGFYTGRYDTRYDVRYGTDYSGGQYASFYSGFYTNAYTNFYTNFYSGFYGSRYGQYRTRYTDRYSGFYSGRYSRYSNRARSG